MKIGDYIKFERPLKFGATIPGLPPPKYVEGEVIFITDNFFTIRTKGGYCESILFADYERMKMIYRKAGKR